MWHLPFFQSLGTSPDCGELLIETSLPGTLASSLRTSVHRHVARPQVCRRAVQTDGLKPFSTSLSRGAPNRACSWHGDLSPFMYSLSNRVFLNIVLIMAHFQNGRPLVAFWLCLLHWCVLIRRVCKWNTDLVRLMATRQVYWCDGTVRWSVGTSEN